MGDHEDASKREEGGGPGAPSFTDDFICVSEFSEIVGPVPLFCIPESGKGSFNIEKFVIRIMAVDYQNKSCDPGAFVDDTQVVITEPTENAFAYVLNLPFPQMDFVTPFRLLSSYPLIFAPRCIISHSSTSSHEAMCGPSA